MGWKKEKAPPGDDVSAKDSISLESTEETDPYSSFQVWQEEMRKVDPSFNMNKSITEKDFKNFMETKRQVAKDQEQEELDEKQPKSKSKSKSSKSAKLRLSEDEDVWNGVWNGDSGPLDPHPQQGAYIFKDSKFQIVWILFLISYFFTGIFTLVAGKVILDELDDFDLIEYSDYPKSPFKMPQARFTGLVMIISFAFQWLTMICDFYCLAVLAIGLPFFAVGDAAPGIAWKRGSIASKIMQIICYANMIPRVALTIISIYIGVAYSPFIDPIDGEKETFVTGAVVISCINLGFAPFLSLIIYLICNLPITAARRRARRDRARRGERTFIYEPFRNLNQTSWSTGTDLAGSSPRPGEEEEEETSVERTFADRVLRRRRDGFHSNPIATRPVNLMRDLMEIEETLREVVDESNGTSNVGPCKEYQLGLIPLCYYLAMDENRQGSIGIGNNPDQDVKAAEEGRGKKKTVLMNNTIDLLGIEPLREIELLSKSNPLDSRTHWLNDIEEEGGETKAEALSKDSIEVDGNPAELSKAERARLRLIGMAKKGKSKARTNPANDETQDSKDQIGAFGVRFNQDVSTSTANASTNYPTSKNEFRIRLRPRPINSKLKYPVLELPENQATCTICLTDYKSIDPALLEGEKNGASKDEKSKKSKLKVEMKDLDSMEPLRLLPCRHTFHKSCIDEWMTKSSARCVICQARVFPKNRAPLAISSQPGTSP